jgi:hypothetical protein
MHAWYWALFAKRTPHTGGSGSNSASSLSAIDDRGIMNLKERRACPAAAHRALPVIDSRSTQTRRPAACGLAVFAALQVPRWSGGRARSTPRDTFSVRKMPPGEFRRARCWCSRFPFLLKSSSPTPDRCRNGRCGRRVAQ